MTQNEKEFIEAAAKEHREHFQMLGTEREESSTKWLRLKLSQAIQFGRTQERQEIKSNLGFMRQWLNEDRITDSKKMVTTEDLSDFLKALTSREEDKEPEPLRSL